jgi:hypothetical protein
MAVSAVSAAPFIIVGVSTCLYDALNRAVRRLNPPSSTFHAQVQNRAISAGHAILTTLLACSVLRQDKWLFSDTAPARLSPVLRPDGNLDDSDNHLIRGCSRLANAITSWETGYLLYDTWALIRPSGDAPASLTQAARRSPVLLGHHLSLAAALLVLQVYIARGRERGIWIIVAFLLMNASNPLLHARWWTRRTGRHSRLLETVFALTFALSRFGLVAWVLGRYGAHHGLGALAAYRRLRIPCQLGTGALVGLNALWWLALVRGIFARRSGKRSDWQLGT